MIATYRVLREYMVDGPGGQFLEMPRRTAKMIYDPRPDCFRMFWQNLDGSWKELFQVHRDGEGAGPYPWPTSP